MLFFKGVRAFCILSFLQFRVKPDQVRRFLNTSSLTANVSEAAQEDLEEHRDAYGGEEGEGEGRRRQDQQRGYDRGQVARKGKRSTKQSVHVFL